jgi:Meiotically Up-regulated Gene 113 (MUG113) protein
MSDQNVTAKSPTAWTDNSWLAMSCPYVIGVRDRGPVKIGFSAEPGLRLRSLQTGYPFKLEILAQCPGGEETEQRVHKLFQKEKLRGEWFKRSPRIRTFIDMISCGVGLSMVMARCSK